MQNARQILIDIADAGERGPLGICSVDDIKDYARQVLRTLDSPQEANDLGSSSKTKTLSLLGEIEEHVRLLTVNDPSEHPLYASFYAEWEKTPSIGSFKSWLAQRLLTRIQELAVLLS